MHQNIFSQLAEEVLEYRRIFFFFFFLNKTAVETLKRPTST